MSGEAGKQTVAAEAAEPGGSLAVRETTRLDVDQIRYIAGTSFVPTHYRGKLPEILACIATGRELGIGDMEALRHVRVIDGVPTLSAQLMVRLVRSRGHSITGDASAEKAVARGRRVDNGDELQVTFTLDDARRVRAKENQQWVPLAETARYKQYPDDMLWARAVSRLCRRLFADVLGPAGYTPQDAAGLPEVDVPEPPTIEAAGEAEPADARAEPPAIEPASSAAEERSLFGQMAEDAVLRKKAEAKR